MEGTWQLVEVYSTFLRIRGQIRIMPGARLSDEVNRLERFMTIYNTITEPLVSSYPVVSPQEANSTIAKASVVMVVPEQDAYESNRALWKEKVRHQIVLNTTAFAMTAEIHLEPKITLGQHIERTANEFLPLTRINAIVVASLGGTPQTFTRHFALVNPASLVSYSVRGAPTGSS
ncbi:MAG TPA: hypothetical protein VG245_01735 [Candidatus Dormibacteraeota bacterium]|jgi:hypothetical protein|nr:hypothetical protein [Candidatus Dormibacteraeota bacterium]